MIFYTRCAGLLVFESHPMSHGSRYGLIVVAVLYNVDSKNVSLLFFHAYYMWALLCRHDGEKLELLSAFSVVF